MTALDRHRELCAKVDAFFARVHGRHGDEMACAAGCDACCRARLTVTPVEAEVLREAAAALPAQERARLVARAAADLVDRCAALEDDGRCAVYAARPLVCRSHGVPLRMTTPRGLPVVHACAKNFTLRGPAAADPDCVLDQTTLSLTLGAIAAQYARETGGAPTDRVPLAMALLDGAVPPERRAPAPSGGGHRA